ncbi:hypothetical protein MAR_021596 [Mya arenaria]|uniref:Uncharacterized protein n=1 Tax=Mya arenaria TaxID=6604 RepID=A0ABY7EBC3_MYAAR|nr:hypothetical protein MAR_021596 [Mya arenaria]
MSGKSEGRGNFFKRHCINQCHKLDNTMEVVHRMKLSCTKQHSPYMNLTSFFINEPRIDHEFIWSNQLEYLQRL